MKTIIFDLDGTLVDLSQGLCFFDVGQLKKLREKYRFALVTGASRKKTLRALRHFGLADLFQAKFIITKDEESLHKSTGMPFRKIKKILDGPAIFVGDSRNDALGCRKTNLSHLLVKKNQDIKLRKINFQKALLRAVGKLENF